MKAIDYRGAGFVALWMVSALMAMGAEPTGLENTDAGVPQN